MSLTFGFTIEDLIGEGRLTRNDLNLVKDSIRNEKLPNYTEELLALFFLACKKNVENTKKCAKAYYYAKKNAPELFNERELSRTDIQQQLEILDFCVMPKRTDDGAVVILHRLLNPEPSLYHMDVAMKVLFMTMDAAIYNNPPTGLIVLFDMRYVGLKHLTRIKFNAVKKFFYYVQEGLPLQLKAIHVLNVVWFFDKIYKLVKPLIKPEVLELLHLHNSDVSMEEFYNKYIQRNCLPSDYGGMLPSVRELHIQNEEKMASMSDFFLKEESLRSI